MWTSITIRIRKSDEQSIDSIRTAIEQSIAVTFAPDINSSIYQIIVNIGNPANYKPKSMQSFRLSFLNLFVTLGFGIFIFEMETFRNEYPRNLRIFMLDNGNF